MLLLDHHAAGFDLRIVQHLVDPLHLRAGHVGGVQLGEHLGDAARGDPVAHPGENLFAVGIATSTSQEPRVAAETGRSAGGFQQVSEAGAIVMSVWAAMTRSPSAAWNTRNRRKPACHDRFGSGSTPPIVQFCTAYSCIENRVSYSARSMC